MKRTVVIGASTNPQRYAYKATVSLKEKGFEVYPVGLREGVIEGIDILTDNPEIVQVDTVTLYLGAARQPPLYDYILSLKPKRLIFNPGTENAELASMASKKGISVEQSCTLVLLQTGQY